MFVFPTVRCLLQRQQEDKAINYSEAKAAKSLAVIVVLFVVSWMPLYVLNTATVVCPMCRVPPSVFRVGDGMNP